MKDQYTEEQIDVRMRDRARRIEEMKRRKKEQEKRRKLLKHYAPVMGGAACLVLLLFVGGSFLFSGERESQKNGQIDDITQTGEVLESQMTGIAYKFASSSEGHMPKYMISGDSSQLPSELEQDQEPLEEPGGQYLAVANEATKQLGDEIVSTHAILVDREADTILASKDAMTQISPASMTKILTILVAAEQVTNLDDTFTITFEITDYSFVNDCSNVGFENDETVTIRDLFYGTILPSGGDAAVALATYVAGSHEAFVDMMNEKLVELGLSDTAHMTNCVGVYDKEHYCTTYDMAIILDAALDNPLCKEVLSAHTYTTSATTKHPEGLVISNWFLRRIEDKDCGGTVLCGKTGYVLQSGSCAASYGEDATGKGLILVTANSSSSWQCIYDQAAIYKEYF